jgi:hypothetical protein
MSYPQAVKGRLKSVSNEGHFTIEAETGFRLYLPSYSSYMYQICHMSMRMRYKQCKTRLNWSIMKDNLPLSTKKFSSFSVLELQCGD